jgi:hypothetical protein
MGCEFTAMGCEFTAIGLKIIKACRTGLEPVTLASLMRKTFREHSGSIQGTFREHSGNIQGTFRERFRNIQGTFTLKKWTRPLGEMMRMIISPFGQLGLWAPSPGV